VAFFGCAGAEATVTAGGFDWRLALKERTLGFRTAGLARTSRGASIVTGGSDRSAVCAFVMEGMADSALQSTSVLALLKAR
jgi:hypothetical protein